MIKDNPMDYSAAFTQMIYAMKYLRGVIPEFETEKYDVQAMMPWKDEILRIIIKRQLDASVDWKALGLEADEPVLSEKDALAPFLKDSDCNFTV